MANELKRLRYFTGEFLQEQDFIDEQAYHRRARYLHNGYMHTPGIVYGLEVTQGPGQKQVTVTAGMGIVKVIENGEELGKETILTTDNTLDLIGGSSAIIYIVIEFDDSEEDTPDLQGRKKRTIEKPKLRQVIPSLTAVPLVPIPDNVGELILAKVTLNASGNGIATLDNTWSPALRLRAGMRGDVEAANVRFAIPGELDATKWPRLFGRPADTITGGDPMRLEITTPLLDLNGNLRLNGGNIVLGVTGLVDGVNISEHVLNNGVGHALSLSHVTGGDTHDHTNGHGGSIPWTALSGIPDDCSVKAYAVVIGSTPVRVGGMAVPPYSIPANPNPVTKNSTGSYTVDWSTEITNPLVLITLQVSVGSLFCQITSIETKNVTFVVRNTGNAPTDPAGFMILVI